ncbi:tubulin polyglutamylase TTLL5-like isoform X3 [Clavelina lepadiformis]|uniref:tubulin polyglutamylase TTLL5-like isoform X3 n=1 Tax=Clavelina lepadiformis TaxID=159417 RepID=UPI0040415C0C
MPGTSEITSDYSGSLTATSSEDEEEEEAQEKNSKQKLNEDTSLLWAGSGSKKCPIIMFRPESLITKDRKLKAIGEKYHLAYKMVKTESKLVRSVLSAYGFHEVHPNSAEFNLMWTGAHLKPFSLRSLQDFQKVNHFPRSYEITRKDRLYKNIERMAHTKGAKHFDFIPKSYLMPSEYQEFCTAYVKEKGSWIVKPIASSRGRGIYLINNPNQVPLEDNIMVCKYINNPLLIDGFKFDVRVYVAVTSYDPLIIYLFEEGLTRFATVKYEKANKHLKNQMMHLTNYSINKKSHDYVRCEDPEVEDYGNKWSMSAMLRYLKQEGIDTSTLMSRIEAVIIKSIIAAELPIATACKMFVPHKENCIEVYGFDILVDENLKPWILEGNLSPSLACDAPLDLKIKSNMIADFFSIAGFRCVDPMTRRQTKKQMDLLQRPYSAQRSQSTGGTSTRMGKRPSSAGYKDAATTAAKTQGLSPDEARVLLMAKEQHQRRGNFVRIFPTAETWELYGSFLEYKSNLNHMLAQKLFPDRLKSTHGAYASAVARIRSMTASQMLESRHHLLAERFMQYERKLFSLESYKKRRSTSTSAPKKVKNKQTPVGIDNKRNKSKRATRNSTSSEYESSDDDEDVESVSTAESKSTKNGQKPKRQTSTNATVKVSKVGVRSYGDKPSNPKTSFTQAKQSKTDATGDSENPRNVVPKRQGQLSDSRADDVKSVQSTSSSSSKAVPHQRVYMYKSTNPSDPSLTSELKTSIMEAKPITGGKNVSFASGTTTKITSDRSVASPRATTLKQDTAASASGDSNLVDNTSGKSTTSVQKSSLKKNKNQRLTNVLDVLNSGGNLGKLQARQAFSAYLSRVQHRLKIESEGHIQEMTDSIIKQEEQMDLVLRFLKRAAGNLCQSFTVVVPSRRLSIIDRKRILSKQLGEFVRIYNKESDALEQKHHLGLEKDQSNLSGEKDMSKTKVSDTEFRAFIVSASEPALEEVLTAYTHINKSASVFLGASRPKSGTTRYHDRDGATSSSESTSGSVISQQSAKSSLQNPSILTQGDELKSASRDKPHHSSNSSLHQANYIYGTKSPSLTNLSGIQKRPSSARTMLSPGNLYSSSHSSLSRPMSASSRPLGSSIHHQTANQEAISDALQRLTERQAARQYSASVQLTALSKHLSNLNLANMASTHNHHGMGSGELHHHGNTPLRTSSLCDLASIEPSVHSMIDPGQNKFTTVSNLDSPHEVADHSGMHQSQESLLAKSPLVLSQQSSALLQQSKAKHQAMLAQMCKARSAQLPENVMSRSTYLDQSKLETGEACVQSQTDTNPYHYAYSRKPSMQSQWSEMADYLSETEVVYRKAKTQKINMHIKPRTSKPDELNYLNKKSPACSAKPAGITKLEKAIWGRNSDIPVIEPRKRRFKQAKTTRRNSKSKATVAKNGKAESKVKLNTNEAPKISHPFSQYFKNPNSEETISYYESLLTQFNAMFDKEKASPKHSSTVNKQSCKS